MLLVLPFQAHAASDPQKAARSCQASQLKAASAFMKSNYGCWSTLFKKLDDDKLLACFAKADGKFVKAYEKAVAKAGPGVCVVEVPAVQILPDLQIAVDDLVDLISSNVDESFKPELTLHSALNKAVGKAFGKALAAQSKSVKTGTGDAKSVAAIARVLPAFEKALDKAFKQGALYFGVGADIVVDEITRIVDSIVDATGGAIPVGRFSVSGQIQIAAATFVDSDVNDVSTTPQPNDEPQDAQQIVVPATIGGYVNTPLAGPHGNSFTSGDESDAYRASIRAGQVATLLIGEDPVFADLDLCLFEVTDTLNAVDCSFGTGSREEIVVPFDGDFFIQVIAFSGSSNYTLIVGQNLSSAGDNGLHLSDDFVAGEVIVTETPGVGVRAATASGFASSLGLEPLAGAPGREMLLRVPAAVRATASASPAGVKSAAKPRFPTLAELSGDKLETILAVKALRRRPDVETADLNYVVQPLVLPNDEFVGLQWHYSLINLPSAWDITTGNAGVKVAVIDTGVVLSHPDLQGRLGTGYDFIRNADMAADGGGIDADPDDPGDGLDRPSSFHGTHVAGTIGAASNNGIGVAGVNWNVELIPVRVLGVGGGTSFDVLEGVRFAAGLANGSGTSNKADVINLSLGGGGFSQTAQNVFTQARDAGVIVVAAAGNENSSKPSYPASYAGVVSVSAVDPLKRRAPYSNFGSAVDVAAPGGDVSLDLNGDGYADGVLSTGADDSSGTRRTNYLFYQGTSMATPHVAGVAALMKAVNPALSPDDFDALLASGSLTQDLGAAGRDDVFGYGLIDARKAVVAAAGAGPGDPIAIVSPTALNLGTSAVVASFSVSNLGGGDLNVVSISDDSGGWLAVTAESVDADGLGAYRVSVDRSGLDPGTYSARISVETSAVTIPIAVVMNVSDADSSLDAGFHYVLLIDPDSLETIDQIDVAAEDSAYVFDFTLVPIGEYLLVAGSDSDNDGFVCGPGEACGAYPTLDIDEPLLVDQDISGLVFTTGFGSAFGAAQAQGSTSPEPWRGFKLLRP